MGMACYPGNGPNDQQTARSVHAGGVTTCFCDGSVHFINDTIQITPFPSVWDKLMLSMDGYPIDASQY